jgi:hypothetical protein
MIFNMICSPLMNDCWIMFFFFLWGSA